jgi:hypothetical protein
MALVAYYIFVIWQQGISNPVDILIRVDLPCRYCQPFAPFLSQCHTACFSIFGARQDCFNASLGLFSVLKLCSPPFSFPCGSELEQTIALKRAKA